MRLRAIAGALASFLAALAAAWADDRIIGTDRLWPPLVLSPPADTGKPLLPPAPGAGVRDPEGCAPALPCGTRLLGTVRRNGGVEFQVPALRW